MAEAKQKAKQGQQRKPQMDLPQRPQQVAPDHDSHGQSVAAWTAVFTIIFGSLVMGAAVILASVPLFVVGVVIVGLGALAGKLLAALGFGVARDQH